jgi:hypothetical protein
MVLLVPDGTPATIDPTTSSKIRKRKRKIACSRKRPQRHDNFEASDESTNCDSTPAINKDGIPNDTNVDQDDPIRDQSRSLLVPSNKILLQWIETFQLFVAYKNKHGNADVPTRYPVLGNWVDVQRSRFEWRIKKPVPPVPWMEMYKRLLSYRDQHDDSTDVPEEACGRLGRWVQTQRHTYGWGKLSNKKITLLESIGFQ